MTKLVASEHECKAAQLYGQDIQMQQNLSRDFSSLLIDGTSAILSAMVLNPVVSCPP